MTTKEAILQLQGLLNHCDSMQCGADDYPIWKKDVEALKIAIAALRPVSREQMEKVWRGEWEHTHSIDNLWTEVWVCSHCGFEDDNGDCFDFCPACGKAMTDEAVEMVIERLEGGA